MLNYQTLEDETFSEFSNWMARTLQEFADDTDEHEAAGENSWLRGVAGFTSLRLMGISSAELSTKELRDEYGRVFTNVLAALIHARQPHGVDLYVHDPNRDYHNGYFPSDPALCDEPFNELFNEFHEHAAESNFLFQYDGKSDVTFCLATCQLCGWENVYETRKVALADAWEHLGLDHEISEWDYIADENTDDPG